MTVVAASCRMSPKCTPRGTAGARLDNSVTQSKLSRMDVPQALDRIEEIHAQMAKGEVFRGYRPLPVALAGALGLLAGVLQPRIVPEGDGARFLAFWLVVALLNVAVNAAVIVAGYARCGSRFARRHTRQVVGQFVPCLLAGAAVSLGLPSADAELVRVLPGVWALLFGLGVFASRPYLARATGWVALWFVVAGTALLAFPPTTLARLGLVHGVVFGAGLLAAAVVLHLDVPREER